MPAFAESGQNITSPDQSGKSDITATVEASNFDITVPLGLPLYLHADGSVSVATDAKIENNSQGPIIVKNVKLTPVDNWKLASFTDNYKTKKVNSKELGFQIMNENVLVDGSVNMKAEDWPSIPGNGDLPLNYDGRVPVRSSDGIMTAANLELTFDWDRLSDEIYTVNITSDENGSAYIDAEDKPITGSYHYGDTINLANASKTGYHFINYTDQNDNIINSPYTIKGPINIKANFEPNNYTVSINKEGNGTVSGSGDYTYNSTVTLKAVPDVGYKFVGWKDKDNNIISTDLNYSFNIVDNTELTAVFTKENYTVSIINDGHGLAYIDTADKPTTGTYHYGDQITLTNTPATGYHFVNYTDSDGNVINSPYTVTGPVTIKANFETNTYTVTANDDGNGTTSGGKDYKYGEQATLTATPNEHYHFINWTDENNDVVSNQSVYSFTVTNNIDYTAHFSIDQFTVILTADTGGSITGTPSGKYNYGTELNITAVPDTGYKFTKWSDNDTNADKTITVTSDINLTADFNIAYQNLTRYNYKGINYDLKDNGTASVSEGTYNDPGNTGLSGNISISDTVIDNNGLSYSLTSIGGYAFSGCDGLTDITIPDSVTSIGDGAFEDCDALTDTTIPDSVTYIGDSAFDSCSSLTDITIPNSVISIGKSAFEYCYDLTSVIIGNSVISMGDRVFYYCDSLASIIIPDSVASIGDSVFTNCTNLTSINVDQNNNYYSSENGVLFNKDKTELIVYPAGKEINTYIIPDTVTRISRRAFISNYSITRIVIPDSVTFVDGYAFQYWSSNQIINIKGKSNYQDTIDAGWDEDWNEDCDAKINYYE